MADEIEDTGGVPEEEGQTPGPESESQEETTTESTKSPEEIAAEEAMLAELEGTGSLDDDGGSGTTEEAGRSAEELAAEKAMLAELEGTGSLDDDSGSGTTEEAGRSAEELAAEEAMLADVEGSAFSQVEADESFQETTTPASFNEQNLDLLRDVTLNVTVELGRKEMCFGEVLALGKGSLVELSKVADEPVDIYVNRSKIAEGEVVVVDDHFGVRITRLLGSEKFKKS